MIATVLWASAAPASTLEQRMQLFRDGSLRGFALAELPANGVETYVESDFEDLAATGANVVRVPIILRKCKGCDVYGWPEAEVQYAQRVLRRGERHGFRVVLVLVVAPWGQDSEFWGQARLEHSIVQQWARVAARLKSFPALQAYDLMNEPVVPAGLADASAQQRWHALAKTIAQELQATDPDTPLMVEPTPWALPDGFWRTPALQGLAGIVYSFHLYAPHSFTHQGLPGHTQTQVYPGHGWDRARLAHEMLEAKRFTARHQVPMFVGEFSCVRWAPQASCPRYLADAIALFETERWGWAYHCWRCYQGWDAELPAELPADAPEVQASGQVAALRRSDSDALMVLQSAMRRSLLPQLQHNR